MLTYNSNKTRNNQQFEKNAEFTTVSDTFHFNERTFTGYKVYFTYTSFAFYEYS